MVGGWLEHSDHEMMEFLIFGEGGGLAEPLLWTSTGQTLACLGAWLTESLGRQF